MKKIALVLAVLLCALPMMAFAEIAVSGSVSFSIGDSNETDPTLPAFSGSSSVTGSVTIATDDEKVVASATFNLLPTVTTTYTGYSNDYYYNWDAGLTNFGLDYMNYLSLSTAVDFYNDHADDETAVAEVTIWTATTEADLQAELKDGTALDLLASDDDTGEITIKDAVDASAETDEFVWSTANSASVNTINAAFQGELLLQVTDAIEKILDEASTATKADLTAGGIVLTNFDVTSAVTNNMFDYLSNTATYDIIKDWTADDKAVVLAALDLEMAYNNMGVPDETPTVESALSFVESASLAFNNVGGIVDIVCNLKGTHVTAGAISVDEAGHQSDAVSGYPSMMIGLSSGVVEGLNAGVTLYIDDNDMQSAVSDTWYTWLDEAEDASEPVYGLGVSGGYSTAVGDMTVGASATFGLYDLQGDKAYAFSIAPSFSGMGANVAVEFDYGLDMMYLMASADYTIMGLTPSVAFHYLAADGDYNLAYNDSPASVMADFKAADGMLLEAGLAADLSELVGMGVSVSGGMDYGLTSSELAWNAGLSVAGLVEGLTVGFDCDADSVEGSTFDYAVSASYAYGIATLSASLGSNYNSDDDANYTSWSVGTSVSF